MLRAARNRAPFHQPARRAGARIGRLVARLDRAAILSRVRGRDQRGRSARFGETQSHHGGARADAGGPATNRRRLGRRLISAGPWPDGSEDDRAEKDACELVETHADAPEVLELVDEAFDEIAPAIDPGVNDAAHTGVALGRDVSGCAVRL